MVTPITTEWIMRRLPAAQVRPGMQMLDPEFNCTFGKAVTNTSFRNVGEHIYVTIECRSSAAVIPEDQMVQVLAIEHSS